ncbi:MAG: NTP transferase domain-containing protein, partial [Candidatus Bipolaricaulaceae bacterium]
MRASGILLAAGRAERFGQDKVFLELGGVPVLVRAARAFQEAGAVEELVVVVRPGQEARAAALLRGLALPVRVVAGGA